MLCGCEINSLRDFLRQAFCYEFEPCSICCGFVCGLLVRLFHSSESLLCSSVNTAAPDWAMDKFVLGWAPALLVFVEKRPDCGQARYCGPVAPCWFSALLAAS